MNKMNELNAGLFSIRTKTILVLGEGSWQ